jgi:hypothetical protein
MPPDESIGYIIKRVYNSLKYKWELCMPDFPEYNWGIYKLRLRPSDRVRKAFAKYGFPDFLNYFYSSSIGFNLRISIPKNKNIQDTINYEWILCTRNDKPVINTGDSRFHFYDTQGVGSFEVVNVNRNNPHYEKNSLIMLFQLQAVKIGSISQSEHYKVVMRFSDRHGSQSDFKCMGQFTIYDKDGLRQAILISIVGIVATAIATLIIAVIAHFTHLT